jgi:mono/diheme cytochrome c family protein
MEEEVMRNFLPAILILVALSLFVSACSSGSADEEAESEHMEDEQMDEHEEEDMHEEGEDEHMEDEHEDMAHAHVEPPEEFADLTNPFAGDFEAIAGGQKIFEINCVTCHGPKGAGDGDAAAGLDPKPANLGDSMMMAELSDGYLFWRVSEGGAMEPFNSAMPSWKLSLSEEQHWQAISYVRTLSEQ